MIFSLYYNYFIIFLHFLAITLLIIIQINGIVHILLEMDKIQTRLQFQTVFTVFKLNIIELLNFKLIECLTYLSCSKL